MLTQLDGLTDDELDAVFGALADRTRRGILASLSEREGTVGDLAEPYAMSRPAISQHLAVLERAGLVDRAVDGRFRRVSIRPARLTGAEAWIAHNRMVWEARLDRLDARIRELHQPHGTPDRHETHDLDQTHDPNKETTL
ncbi:MAG: ArsR/SmtB family transcription factor [Dermatophilaceae bacterium]